jgi:hypothetical protein
MVVSVIINLLMISIHSIYKAIHGKNYMKLILKKYKNPNSLIHVQISLQQFTNKNYISMGERI